MKFRNHKMAPAELQLAPMLDVVFQLLIFFIVTFEFHRSEMDLKVSVPRAQEGADTKRARGEIIVNVRANGEVAVEGQTMTQAQLGEKLSAIAKLHGTDQPIRLRGDEKTDFQKIVTVVDICQKAGIWNISFATQRPSQ
ncbi:biopolymer transporter ExbD [Haloferula sp. BvORR071]|uniref:ExbD/TolR family protein n=1 Tax=Haloferula sp. BvORR071 TaxID=1396141 RepID=UPI0006964ADF|nr:biopolymer transporter ExbD [Haloferula sp. BvORR071]